MTCLAWKPHCVDSAATCAFSLEKDCALSVPASHTVNALETRIDDDIFMCLRDSDGTNTKIHGNKGLIASLGVCSPERMDDMFYKDLLARVHPDAGQMAACPGGFLPVLDPAGVIQCVKME